LQFLALLFALVESIPNSAENCAAGLAIFFMEDAAIMGNGGGKRSGSSTPEPLEKSY
jgi:hypothetical protein